MRRWLALSALLLLVAACGSTRSAAIAPASSPSTQAASSLPVVASPSAGAGSRSPAPSPSPTPTVTCRIGASAGAMVMIDGAAAPISNRLIYDVTDPLHPRLLCTIANTTAHLFTGDTFAYLKNVSATETDVMLHSIGSGNESKAASFPLNLTDQFRGDIEDSAWTPDGGLLPYTVVDESANLIHVWLYSQGKSKLVHDYGMPIGDCICRFGLQQPVLAFSPDLKYLVDGWHAGKGSTPLTVIRVSDGATVFTADISYYNAIWGSTGHQLYLIGNGLQSWTPEAGQQGMLGNPWSYLPGVSPDGSTIAYTAYSDPDTVLQPRSYTYDLKTDQTHLLVDKLRTQVLFVKDGWVWYLEERECTASDHCAGSTLPTGNVLAMQLSTAVEQPVAFASGESPFDGNWWSFTPGEYWPNS